MTRRTAAALLLVLVAATGARADDVTFHPDSGFNPASDQTITGTWTFPDNGFFIDDGGDGNTLSFQLSSLTTDRIVTWQDAAGTVPLLDRSQTWGPNGVNVFSMRTDFSGGALAALFYDNAELTLGSGGDVLLKHSTAQTPDSAYLGVGAESNALIIGEAADKAFDFAHPLLTQPGIVLQSEDQSTTQYTRYQAGAITTQRRRVLTEAGAAEQLFQITTATLESGGGEIDYKVHATDGTDFAVRQGKIRFVFYNNAGTVTATLSAAAETTDGSVAIVSAGETLTYAVTADVATANVFKLMINIDSNIAVNAAHADYIVTYNGPGEVVFP